MDQEIAKLRRQLEEVLSGQVCLIGWVAGRNGLTINYCGVQKVLHPLLTA